MSNDPIGPSQNEPLPKASHDPGFMKEFEKVIKRYAEAASDGRAEEAQNAAMQALMMASEDAVKNPTPNLLLKKEAHSCETQGDWAAAEAAYRKALALEESSGNLGMIAKAHMDLCRLLRVLGRLDEARQFACEATAAARRTQIFPVLSMALDLQAHCALDRGDRAAALKASSEAVQVIEPGRIYDSMRAKALITHAKCSLASGDSAAADADLVSSWELLQARFSTLMPGPLLTLANWWEVKSQLEEHRRNLNGARESISRAIEYFRQLQGTYGLLAVARALQQASRLSTLAGDLLDAERTSAEVKQIRSDLRLVFDG
jgi:tetratricopeptide (TPR) repeat protein